MIVGPSSPAAEGAEVVRSRVAVSRPCGEARRMVWVWVVGVLGEGACVVVVMVRGVWRERRAGVLMGGSLAVGSASEGVSGEGIGMEKGRKEERRAAVDCSAGGFVDWFCGSLRLMIDLVWVSGVLQMVCSRT